MGDTYDTIDRPYDNSLNRDGDQIVSPDIEAYTGGEMETGGTSGATTIKTGDQLDNLWIRNFIKSENWKPKTAGFYLEGGTGYAEFSNVYIVGNITATSGTFGGWTIAADELYSGNLHLKSSAEQILVGSATDPETGVGIFIGKDGSNYEFRVGDPSGTRIHYDGSALNIVSPTLTSAVISSIGAGTELALQGWVQTCTFSATDLDTVAWTSGTFKAADGTTYSIGAGNTGNMTSRTYIYLNIAVSTTAYQTSTTATDAVGVGKVLIAVAEDSTDNAFFQVFGGSGGILITANEVAANAITANNIDVSNLAAISANLGTITAGNMTIDSSGYIKGGQTAFDTGTGFWLGYDTSAYKFSIGDSDGAKMTWDGSTLSLRSYHLLDTFTAGEAIGQGDLVCFKNATATWGNDPQASLQTTALHSALTYVDPTNPTTNYGGASLLYLGVSGSAGYYYIYGKLDIFGAPPTLPPWQEIEKVTLRIYVVFTGTARAITLSRVTSSWTEGSITSSTRPTDDGVTWATAKTCTAIQSETVASVANGTDDGYIEFDITDLYKLWYSTKITNYGYVLKMEQYFGDTPIRMGGRTRSGGGDYLQAPYLYSIIVRDNLSVTAFDGKVYTANYKEYNRVKHLVGIAKNAASANDSVDVYLLANGSTIPGSYTVGRTYYLTDSSGSIGFLATDIIENGVYNIRIGVGTSSGLFIDYDNKDTYIYTSQYPNDESTGLLPPPNAKKAVIRASFTCTTSPYGYSADLILEKPFKTTASSHNYQNNTWAYSMAISATWNSGTSGLLTVSCGSGVTISSRTIYIDWYR